MSQRLPKWCARSRSERAPISISWTAPKADFISLEAACATARCTSWSSGRESISISRFAAIGVQGLAAEGLDHRENHEEGPARVRQTSFSEPPRAPTTQDGKPWSDSWEPTRNITPDRPDRKR